jgi:hypothetical protein
VLLALLLIVVGLVAFAAWLSWVLAGGWDGLRSEAEPDDRAVVAARRLAPAPLDGLTAAVLAAMDRSTSADLVRTARVRTDDCHEGQNNWKVHSGFTLRCELDDVVALRLHTTPTSSLRAASASEPLGVLDTVAREMHSQLQRDGWTETFARSGLHVTASGSRPGLRGYYSKPASSLRGAAGGRTGSLLGLEIDLFVDPPPDYALPRPDRTGLGQTRRVDGDLTELRQSMADGPAPRILVQVSLPYFED